MELHSVNKAVIAKMRFALYDYEPERTRDVLAATFAPDAAIRIGFPFEDLHGPDELYEKAFVPLSIAIPDLERRDTIVMAGTDAEGNEWVGCVGYYTGTFARPWLDIPPTGHQVALRFHEFFRLEGSRVVEMQAIWDIPNVMMQVGVWPMAPSLGWEWHVPGPATQDGIHRPDRTSSASAENLAAVIAMGVDLVKHPAEPPEVMRLENYFHPKFSWYGPSGIGTARGIDGFRNWHQIPFLRGMPDRGDADSPAHLFADNNYVAVTGWPDMKMTITGDGWMGIAPSDQQILARVMDFWRVENGLIRENWVMIDILSVYHQVGVDVFARMRELNKARAICG